MSDFTSSMCRAIAQEEEKDTRTKRKWPKGEKGQAERERE